MVITLGKLKEFALKNSIPDSAKLMVWADHGQNEEKAHYLSVSRDKDKNPEEMIFEYDNYEDCYDEDVLEEYDKTGEITAILISN